MKSTATQTTSRLCWSCCSDADHWQNKNKTNAKDPYAAHTPQDKSIIHMSTKITIVVIIVVADSRASKRRASN